MVLRATALYGKNDSVRKLVQPYYLAVAEVFKKTDTFRENDAPATIAPGIKAAKDFCGWNALLAITVLKKYMQT